MGSPGDRDLAISRARIEFDRFEYQSEPAISILTVLVVIGATISANRIASGEVVSSATWVTLTVCFGMILTVILRKLRKLRRRLAELEAAG